MASYPTSVKTFTTKNSGDTIEASHINDLQGEVNAVEAGLLNGISHDLNPSTASTRAVGTTTKPWKTVVCSTLLTDRIATVTGSGQSLNIDAGPSTISSLVVSGRLVISSGLDVAGASSIHDIVISSGTANLSSLAASTITVDRITSTISTGANIHAGASTIAGITLNNSTLTVPGDIICGQVVRCNALISTALTVVTNSTFAGGVQINGNSTIGRVTISSAAPASPDTNSIYADSIIKAWVSFSSAPAILRDVNVSAVAGSTELDVTFATALEDSNYSVAGSVNGAGNKAPFNTVNKATTGFTVNMGGGGLDSTLYPGSLIVVG